MLDLYEQFLQINKQLIHLQKQINDIIEIFSTAYPFKERVRYNTSNIIVDMLTVLRLKLE